MIAEMIAIAFLFVRLLYDCFKSRLAAANRKYWYVALDILEGRRCRLMPLSCPTNVSRRTGRASGPLPQLASLAAPEAEAPLPADPHASTSRTNVPSGNSSAS